MRQIVLDTETTGLSTAQGHRIIEIGCVELVNRRLTGSEFHRFLNPDRDIDEVAEQVHGISLADLELAPRFPEIVDALLEYRPCAELVLPHARFAAGFPAHCSRTLQPPTPQIEDHATVLDTLALARKLHPGQRNSLDALCKRYEIDASRRDVHGALIDSELRAGGERERTGGQATLSLDTEPAPTSRDDSRPRAAPTSTVIIKASATEAAAHDAMLEKIRKSGACVWDID